MLTTEQELLIRALRVRGLTSNAIAQELCLEISIVDAMCKWIATVGQINVTHANRFYFDEVQLGKPRRCPYCGGRTWTDPCRVCRQREFQDRQNAFQEIARNAVQPQHWSLIYETLAKAEEEAA